MKHSPVHLLAIVLTGLSLAVHAGENPVLTEGFKRADNNNDGKLSADEVNQFPRLKTRLQGADKNGDGLITFDEFRTHLAAGARPPGAPASPVTRLGPGEHSIQNWVKANGCDAKPEIVPLPDKANDGMRVTRKTWAGGKDGSEVILIEIEGGGHTWPGMEPPVAMLGKSTKDISANDLMWEFFQKHPMKQSPAPPRP